jgi:hypothetical protein
LFGCGGAQLFPATSSEQRLVAALVFRIGDRILFERLPRTVPDGDAAIAEVWRLVAEQRELKPGTS